MYEVVWLSLVHQSYDRAGAWKRSSQQGLKQGMGSNLYEDGIVWNVLKSFLEQHRADEIVVEVVGRRVECQLR